MEISWIYGLIGGLMIGCAAAVYLLVNGRIMGASGIAGSIVDGSAGSAWGERAAFLAGVIGVPAVASVFMDMPATNVTSNVPLLIVAGVLVGFGTRLGSGCTSGHGVCGMSRLSVRSIIATVIYIGAGVLVIIAARGMGVL
ncbi:MAG: YeeE/YedE family protein [Amylibacter sp.]|jgi:uncharacterized protein|nr:YeeE/YedE family protein [Amylibacter sp.]